ncbi:MAG: hypothetical protein AB8G95_19055 [Anaerolineae bacterium]
MSDPPNLVRPPEKQPGWFDFVMARLGGIISLVGIISAMGYLIIPLAITADGSCTYRGDIEIHPPFLPVFEKNCLMMGPPISRIDTVPIEGYGDRTIQYFEGVLLMAPPNGNSQEVEVFPLGVLSQPETQSADFLPDTSQFFDFLAETENDQFLGEPVTSFIQMGDRFVIYYENTSLRWNPNSQTVSHQSLGRDHLLNNNPELLVEDGITQIFIPQFPNRTSPINTLPVAVPAEDYAVHVSVKYPVLYTNNQQVVTVEVINRISSEPVIATDLVVTGFAQFSDLENTDANRFDLELELTNTPGIYKAIINLPDHPNGNAGREVIIDVSAFRVNSEKVSTIKKFQTWW